jgi:hypothetical protein
MEHELKGDHVIFTKKPQNEIDKCNVESPLQTSLDMILVCSVRLQNIQGSPQPALHNLLFQPRILTYHQRPFHMTP